MSGPVVRAWPADIDALAELVAEACVTVPAAEWLVPDSGDRRRVLAAAFAVVLGQAFGFGHVDMLADRTGAAVWIQHDRPVPEPADVEARLRAVAGAAGARRLVVTEGLLAEARPSWRERHHHLALLAVDPRHQRHGRGGQLVDRHLRWLDRNHMPATTVAPTPEAVAFFARRGFEVRPPLHVPGGVLHPMWRAPEGRTVRRSRPTNQRDRTVLARPASVQAHAV